MSTEAAPKPTYWLQSKESCVTGPFTKTEARQIIEDNPAQVFTVRREGEENWQDPAVRLAQKNSPAWIVLITVLVIIFTIPVIATWLTATQQDIRQAERLGLTPKAPNPEEIRAKNRSAWLAAIAASNDLSRCVSDIDDESSIESVSDRLYSAHSQAEDPALKTRIDLVIEAARDLKGAGWHLRIVQKLFAEHGGDSWRARVEDERAKALPIAEKIGERLTNLRLALADWEPAQK